MLLIMGGLNLNLHCRCQRPLFEPLHATKNTEMQGEMYNVPETFIIRIYSNRGTENKNDYYIGIQISSQNPDSKMD